jgi:hypothetical protein
MEAVAIRSPETGFWTGCELQEEKNEVGKL